VIFEDKFEDDGGGWDADKNMEFKKSSMTVKIAGDDASFRELNSVFVIKDGDLCVEATFPTNAPDTSPAVGLLFWATDYNNMYLFQTTVNGGISLARLVNKQWGTIVLVDQVPSVKTGPGATNTLRVVLKGNLLSAYINDVKFRDQRAQPPANDSRFGIYAERATPGPEQISIFKNYKVTGTD
jgi:hypothetical protein